jgi:hypothetical protein
LKPILSRKQGGKLLLLSLQFFNIYITKQVHVIEFGFGMLSKLFGRLSFEHRPSL